MKNYFKLMRTHHYIKNFLIFTPLIFNGQLLNKSKLLCCLLGFLAFCMISSCVYIINDIKDKKYDMLHTSKKQRPIASGVVSIKNAFLLFLIIFLLAMFFNYKVYLPQATLLLLFYFAINLLYSLGLKNIPLIDVTILVTGFVIRVMYGAFISGIPVSNWLYLTVITIAFYFSLGKRRNELNQQIEVREVLKNYSHHFLDKNMYMCLTLANVFYSLWASTSETAITHSKHFVFTIPLVLLICMKYSMCIEREADADPVEILLHDKVLLFLCILYSFVLLMIIYM